MILLFASLKVERISHGLASPLTKSIDFLLQFDHAQLAPDRYAIETAQKVGAGEERVLQSTRFKQDVLPA